MNLLSLKLLTIIVSESILNDFVLIISFLLVLLCLCNQNKESKGKENSKPFGEIIYQLTSKCVMAVEIIPIKF